MLLFVTGSLNKTKKFRLSLHWSNMLKGHIKKNQNHILIYELQTYSGYTCMLTSPGDDINRIQLDWLNEIITLILRTEFMEKQYQ